MNLKCNAEYWALNKAFVIYGGQNYSILPRDHHLFQLLNKTSVSQAHDVAMRGISKIAGGIQLRADEVFASNDRISFFGEGFYVEWIAANNPIGD